MAKRKRSVKDWDIDWTLRKQFGKANFRFVFQCAELCIDLLTYLRPLQREVITAALEKNDVYLQAATSFGKSLCYQLPAVIDHGSMSYHSVDS